MTPIENLTQEHRTINEMLEIIMKIASDIKEQKVFYPEDIEVIVDFLKSFWDKCHNQKEEKALYPDFFNSAVVRDDKSFKFIVDEHSKGRFYINEMILSVEKCKLGENFSCHKFADCLIDYSKHLQSHIKMEEEVLFPKIDNTLTVEQKIKMMHSFERIEEESIGRRIYLKYIELAAQLKTKYAQIENNINNPLKDPQIFIYG